MEYIWVIYHEPSRSYEMTTGYYGNEHNIMGFDSRPACEFYITRTYYGISGYKAKRMKIK